MSRHRWISYLAFGILGYFLLVEHRQHVLPYLPFLFLAACPLMHFFMHSGHHHSGNSSKGQEKTDEPR